jgi:predicted nuclease with TOPRIM domain
MPKIKNIEYNPLIEKELPPPSGGGGESDYTYSASLSKLLHRFVRLTVPHPDDISFDDIELLDDVMHYGSLAPLAQKRKITGQAVSLRLKNAIGRLDERVAQLERIADSEQQLAEAKERIAQLEQELADTKTRLQQELGTANARCQELEEKYDKTVGYVRQQAVYEARYRNNVAKRYLRQPKKN